MEQTSVGQLIAEEKGITHKKVIVMFERSNGDIILVDSSESKTFYKDNSVSLNPSYVVVAFSVPITDLTGTTRRLSKFTKLASGGVYGFFKNYKLTAV